MRVCWRPVAPREIDYELLWLTLTLGSLAAAAVWFALGLAWPGCIFLTWTGYPCATCGATRAAIQFFHGHFFAAFKWNPLGFAGLCAISIFDAYAAAVLFMGAPRLRIFGMSGTERNLVRLLVVSMLALNWIYLLANADRFV
jgi:hypothetical protein